jgi:YggT family protein
MSPAAALGASAATALATAGPASAALLDVGTANAIRSVMGKLTSVVELLFLGRIIMAWFPKAMKRPKEMPWGAVFMPTELFCGPTRKLVNNLNGVDVTPVIWFLIFSLSNELVWSRQGLLMVIAKS